MSHSLSQHRFWYPGIGIKPFFEYLQYQYIAEIYWFVSLLEPDWLNHLSLQPDFQIWLVQFSTFNFTKVWKKKYDFLKIQNERSIFLIGKQQHTSLLEIVYQGSTVLVRLGPRFSKFSLVDRFRSVDPCRL